jgi:hypothetical protein
LLLGVVIGVVGTGVHRLSPPWGLVIALGLVLVGGVVARAWSGGVGMLAVALGVATATAVLGARGPGGDVLVVADVLGYIWYAGGLMVALALLLPRSWFSEDRRPPRERA